MRPRCAQLPFPAGRNGHYAAVQLRLSVRIAMAAESCGLVLCKRKRLCYTLAAREYLCRSFLGSSAVEHPTVNRMVAGSNPARGARGFFRHRSRRFAPLLKSAKNLCKISTSWRLGPPRRFVIVRQQRQVFRVKTGYRQKTGYQPSPVPRVRNEAGSYRFSVARPQTPRGAL